MLGNLTNKHTGPHLEEFILDAFRNQLKSPQVAKKQHSITQRKKTTRWEEPV